MMFFGGGNRAPKLFMMCVPFKIGHGYQEKSEIVREGVNSDSAGQARGIKGELKNYDIWWGTLW